MTLHEAIEKVLRLAEQPMTTQQIADALNRNRWYRKRDGSKITTFQIQGRTKNYSGIFGRKGSIVSLKGQPASNKRNKSSVDVVGKPKPNPSLGVLSVLEAELMDENNFRSAAIIDKHVPHSPGIYCIRIREVNNLPKLFADHLLEREHNIIYIGIASGNLNRRFLNQELRAKGHGTFFRSIGAILGHRPERGSLVKKRNKRNFKFSPADNEKIILWINEHLIVNWVELKGDYEAFEKVVIGKHRPLLNLAKNPSALGLLSDLRKECVNIANMQE